MNENGTFSLVFSCGARCINGNFIRSVTANGQKREQKLMHEEDNRPKPAGAITPGEDVSMLSISELEERIAEMAREIERLRGVIKSKNESKAAADSVFKL